MHRLDCLGVLLIECTTVKIYITIVRLMIAIEQYHGIPQPQYYDCGSRVIIAPIALVL
jgi:hypothetical protein